MPTEANSETTPVQPSNEAQGGTWRGRVLSWVLPLQIVVFLGCLLVVWFCLSPAKAGSAPSPSMPVFVSWIKATLARICDGEVGLLLLVIFAGALGGSVHALNSFVNFVGARSFVDSWFQWYLQRAPIGAGLAVIIYVALRAGLMNGVSEVNHFGFAAAALLTGMFNKEALEKLQKVAVAFFTAAPERPDTLGANSPAPELVGIEPVTAPPDVDLVLLLKGNHFTADTRVVVDGKRVDPTFLTDKELKVKVSASDLKTGAVLKVAVAAGPNGPESATKFDLKVT